MKMQVQKLREVLKILEPVVPRKTALPVLHNILLGEGKATATDLEVKISVVLPEAKEECLIPFKSVFQMLKYVPGNEIITIKANKMLNISWESGNSSYALVDPKDYPAMAKVKPKAKGVLDGDILITAMSSMVNYCATDETRPVLSGVAILPGDILDIAAGDGFRMAYQTVPLSFPLEQPLVIPSRAAVILKHAWDRTPPDVPPGDSLVKLVTNKRKLEMKLGDELLEVCFGRVTIIIKLISGNPPNFKQLIPQDIPLKIQLFPSDMERAVQRLRVAAKDSEGIIRLNWTKDTMTVSAKSDEMGNIEATFPVQAEDAGQTAINIRYLLDYLKGKEGLVTMGITSDKSPIVFRHRSSPLVIIMPMLVK
jgi:DNA polymerase-3 subunit beta